MPGPCYEYIVTTDKGNIMACTGKPLRAALILSAFLAGCGGGGGGGNAWTPIASTEVFQLKAAWDNIARATGTRNFSVSGTYAGAALSGTGSVTLGALTGTVFEGIAAQQKTSTIRGTITLTYPGGSRTDPLAETASAYYDSNYLPLGSSSAEYTVVTGGVTIPATARVGDSGTTYTENRYADATRARFLGTYTYTYRLEADTATTALVRIVGLEKDDTGASTGSTETLLYRITPAGMVTPISETLADSDGSTVLTYN